MDRRACHITTEDTFLFYHFVNPKTCDPAVGISVPPARGHLIILTKRNGRCVQAGPVVDTGPILAPEPLKLFTGPWNSRF